MDIDAYLSAPSGVHKGKIKLRLIVESNGNQYEKCLEGTPETLKSFITKINTKAKKEEETLRKALALGMAQASMKSLSNLSLGNLRTKDSKESKESSKDSKESKESTKESKESSKASKDSKESAKESKDAKESSKESSKASKESSAKEQVPAAELKPVPISSFGKLASPTLSKKDAASTSTPSFSTSKSKESSSSPSIVSPSSKSKDSPSTSSPATSSPTHIGLGKDAIGNKDAAPAPAPNVVPHDPKFFGVALDTLMDRQKSDPSSRIPVFIRNALKHLFVNGLAIEGLFRISASQADVVSRKAAVDKGDIQMAKDENHHVITSLVKIFLRELPEPICTNALYDTFLAASDQVVNGSLDTLKKVLVKLPENNKTLLQHLVHFLTMVSSNAHVNLMNHSNLGRIFGPNLFWRKETSNVDMYQLQATSDKVNNLAEALIVNYKELFEEPLPSINGRLTLQTKMLGHKKSVQWLALVDQDKRVCSLDTLGLLKVWDSQSNQLLHEFSICEQGAIVYSMVGASNDTIWTATSQSTSIWSLDGKLIGEIPGETFSICESQLGEMWVAGNQVISIYRLADVPTTADTAPIRPISTDIFNQNMFILALCRVGKTRMWGCSSNKLLYVWDVNTKEILHKTELSERRPKRIAYVETDDYEAVWVGGDEGTIQIINANTYELMHRVENNGWDKLFVLATIGREVWSSTWDICVRLWEPKSREVTTEIKGNHADAVSAILEVPNLKGGDSFIWFGSNDKSISTYQSCSAASSKWSTAGAKRTSTKGSKIGFTYRG
ncbi:hypothetical protein SAMD00019534_063430 [Acytostelium subglobosum LB1]|uniref:hypothetical protein n=1 Tax=Acytostelium subglobosum LB1 TaxID=1410327 RepID=UPI0006449205|nr:hypothetical protein SAMD00019534_063430 [Acytostelium subglobosum LB1]GAM23168.1 hypothetical protein SAMD00019534_063430 [Acytostelium subglobosum LB1]|eukprot:XP_012753617.1 hypothetical protein SAMD00019534_063430 [Acytostelium subglobosum LB1]